jgi:hypothetical protein
MISVRFVAPPALPSEFKLWTFVNACSVLMPVLCSAAQALPYGLRSVPPPEE